MKKTTRGYTLIELMVALLLGLILVGAALGVYLSGRQAGRYSDALGRYQETVRYAQAVISEELRMAGFFGCFQVPVSGTPDVSIGGTKDPVNVSPIFNGYSRPIYGVEGAGGPPHKEGTDVIQVQHASRQGGWLNADTAEKAGQTTINGSPFLVAGDLAVISNCSRASVFNVLNVTADAPHVIGHNSLGALYLARNADSAQPSQVFGFLNRFLYVRREITEEGPRDVLTLRTMHGDGGFLDEDIAEGIEDLQFWYGYDAALPNSENQLTFWTADQVPDTNEAWRRVLSVRVCMLSVSSDNGLATTAQTYTDCQGNIINAEDTRIRFPITFTVNLRNRVQGWRL